MEKLEEVVDKFLSRLGKPELVFDSEAITAGQLEMEMAGITMDITEGVRWREEHLSLLSRIADDKAALEKADHHKDEFIATLAHELRRVLTASEAL